ncbi:hypothetical protein [Streptomyces sp. NPDC007905]|uniref:hypothetical protein n=1 Tax=Streptomyces sp. NPDC007905 TaxID=3364788 RepID=UPI0036F0DE55
MSAFAGIATRPGDEQSRRDRTPAVLAAWGLVVSTLLLGAARELAALARGFAAQVRPLGATEEEVVAAVRAAMRA